MKIHQFFCTYAVALFLPILLNNSLVQAEEMTDPEPSHLPQSENSQLPVAVPVKNTPSHVNPHSERTSLTHSNTFDSDSDFFRSGSASEAAASHPPIARPIARGDSNSDLRSNASDESVLGPCPISSSTHSLLTATFSIAGGVAGGFALASGCGAAGGITGGIFTTAICAKSWQLCAPPLLTRQAVNNRTDRAPPVSEPVSEPVRAEIIDRNASSIPIAPIIHPDQPSSEAR